MMQYREMSRPVILLLFVFVLLCAGVASQSLFAKNETNMARRRSKRITLAHTTHARRVAAGLGRSGESGNQSHQHLFHRCRQNKRFISDLKAEDIRVFEDGQPQEIFTFQTNIDLPLSLAILIDTSASEERTLPDEKEAARAFLENVMRANKDEAAVLSFTGETTFGAGLLRKYRTAATSDRPRRVYSTVRLHRRRRGREWHTANLGHQPESRRFNRNLGRRLGHFGRVDQHFRGTHATRNHPVD